MQVDDPEFGSGLGTGWRGRLAGGLAGRAGALVSAWVSALATQHV